MSYSLVGRTSVRHFRGDCRAEAQPTASDRSSVIDSQAKQAFNKANPR